ncbi:MAG: hypothetical protein ACTHOD_20880 [Motilibacteraceae bacterium]
MSARRMLSALRRRVRPRGEAGNAIVEFCFLAILLMVPLTYVVIAVLQVQGAAYAVTTATREAARAFATAATGEDPSARAALAARLALADHDLVLDPASLDLTEADRPRSCVPGTVTCPPVRSVTVRLSYQVSLPFLPRLLGRDLAGVRVRSEHVEVLDRFRSAP